MEQRISIQFYIKKESFIKKLVKRILELLIVVLASLGLASLLLFLVQEIRSIHVTNESYTQNRLLIPKAKQLKMLQSIHDTIAIPSISSTIEPTIKESRNTALLVDSTKAEKATENLSVASMHIVEENETLYHISVQNKVSVEDLKTINHLTNNIIQVGMALKIPQRE